jgi:hypothetical protein
MSKLIFYGILIYLLYKFVFELVVPVGKASTQMRQTVREMQEQQLRQQQQAAAREAEAQKQRQAQATARAAQPAGDYIDFEELK